MGVVYLVRKPGVARDLALKVISGSKAMNELSRERFRREVKLLARVRHPAVIRVHDAGEDQGVLWYVMDVVSGESLDDLVRRRGPLPEADACALMEEVARAVDAIHEAGIVHRDLKPGNVLVDARTGKPLIADFGLARDVENEERLTRTGSSVGTPSYMAPEQVRAEKDVDARADVYALGAILYYALTGHDPLECATLVELVNLIVSTAPAPPSWHVRSIRPAVDAVCARALAKTRNERPPTARAFAEALARVREQPAPSRDAPRPARPRLAVVGLALLVSLPLLAAGPLTRLSSDESDPGEVDRRAELARIVAANHARADSELPELRRRFANAEKARALELARSIYAREPDDPRALAAMGRVLVQNKAPGEAGTRDLARGRALIDRAAALAPRNASVLLALAEAISYDPKKPDLKPTLREVLERGDRVEAVDAAALWLDVVGPEELDRLLEVADKAASEEPRWPRAHFVRALVLEKLHRDQEARAELDRCVELAPRDMEARHARARCEITLDEYAAAAADLQVLLDAFPTSGTLAFEAAVVEDEAGHPDDALRLLDRALTLWHSGAAEIVHGRRGLLLLKMNDPARAVADLEIAASVPIPVYRKGLARAYARLGELTKAREAYDRLLLAEPGDTEAILEAGAVREQTDGPDLCADFYRAALANVTDRLGRLKVRQSLLEARHKEVDRQIAVIKAALDACKAMPKGPEQTAEQARIQGLLDVANAYADESKKILDEP
jgi:tetratricopeptide (TPR) repeat protein/predicted Ser/Thr protein kinase